jgi:hypothetical protein
MIYARLGLKPPLTTRTPQEQFMFENYVTQLEIYFGKFWHEIESWELWGKPSEWFVGIVAGVIGGYVTLLFVSMRVPKLGISQSIALTNGIARVKVINKRRRWGMFDGNALALKAQLHLLKTEGIAPLIYENDDVSILRHRKFFRKSDQNEYIFRVAPNRDLKSDLSKSEVVSIRFQVTARDSFSNYERMYTQIFHKEDAVTSRPGYKPLVVGDFKGPGDLRIVPVS